MSAQWLRKVSLLVFPEEGDGLDLSQLQFKFSTKQKDIQSPNSIRIRVYNLSDQTAKTIQNEFTRVSLSCGYENGNFGQIFIGNIVQLRQGKENATDKYLDILAADGDAAYNFALVRQSIAAGSTAANHVTAAVQSLSAVDPTITQGYTGGLDSAPKLPRGKVLYGMARDVLRDVGKSTGTQWSIQNGVVQTVPINSYLPGDAIVLTSQTGMISIPEQTIDGITITALLNPQFQVAGRVQIDNASIAQTLDTSGFYVPYDAFTGFQYLAKTNPTDGIYRILVAQHEGDTRGNEWYSKLICISVDDTVPPSQALRGRT